LDWPLFYAIIIAEILIVSAILAYTIWKVLEKK